MDITPLKEKLGDETFTKLETYVTDLIGQRDAARTESIDGSKKLKAELATANARATKAFEKLGVDSDEELDALPDAKGQAEATKQLQTRLSKAERERDEAIKSRDDETGKRRELMKSAAVTEALAGHDFVARDLVETTIARNLEWDGDNLLFKTNDGKLVSVKDGVAGFAKARPELLKPAGTGGAGARQSAGGGGKTIDKAEFDAKPATERARLMADGYTLTET